MEVRVKVPDLSDSSDDKDKCGREDSPACKALQNHIIMHNIMRRLDIQDLKTCRIVNLTWNSVSSNIMKNLDCCQVQLTYDDRDRRDDFYKLDQQDPNKENTMTISQLHKILDSSINFPCTDFLIHNPGYMRRRTQGLQLVKFFNSHGHKIRSLTLSLLNIGARDNGVHYDLLSQVPNIENLNYLSHEIRHGSGELSFPKLKRFTWLHHNEIVSNILRNSPNLEIVQSQNMLMDLEHVIKAGKSYAIKILVCENNYPTEIMSSLIQAKLQIEELTFSFNIGGGPSRHVFDLMTHELQNFNDTSQLLIQACSETLKQLDFSNMPATHTIVLPEFPVLTKFAVGVNFRQTCFPPGTDLLETFPNLHKLDLSAISKSRRKRGNLQSYFPPPPILIGNLPTMVVLEISSGDLSMAFMRRLRTNLCPNFKKLVIHDDKEIHEIRNLSLTLKKVFKVWKHLTSIEIKDLIFGSIDLDSVLTGIAVDDVKILYKEDGSGPQVSTYSPAKKSSIVFMEVLEYLTFIFSDYSAAPRKAGPAIRLMEKPFLFSHVTCFHAFNIMPNLNVCIIWDRESKILRGLETDMKSMQPNLKVLSKKPKPV